MNKKIKRIIPIILSVLSCASLTLAACGHTHEWEWKSGNGKHWQECKRCDETTTPEEHKDTDGNNVCDDCGESLAPATVAVTGVTVNGEGTVVEGQSITLTATVAPDNATDKTVTWTSSDTNVATVNGGVVTGVAEGTVTITATAGGVEGTKTITVTAAQGLLPPVGGDTVAVEKVELNKTTASLTVGGSEQLTATVTPSNATDATVSWSSSDTAKVTVNQQGVISAVEVGSATITATAGDKTAECEVTVTEAQGHQPPVASTPLPAGKKIYVVGDSTVCSFSDNYYLPRYGYGTQLAEYLNVTSDQIVNLAISGRSSKSFLTESNYTTLTNSISEGDYLIIGFGHNDEKQGAADAYRYTNPVKSYTDDSTAGGVSFQYNLNENYIKLATSKGATPILCTPIVRYDKSGEYTGNSIHITNDKDGFKGGDYSLAIKTLGAATNTAVIDLTELTKEVYKADNDGAQYFHAHTKYKGEKPNETPDGIDTTHINKYGAKMVAYQFANALKETDSSLKAHVKDEISAPTKAVDYAGAINQSYVRPPYTVFNPSANASRKLTGSWYKTAMGNLGGNKAGNFNFSVSEDKITVGTKVNTGKIEDNPAKEAHSDGFGAAFMQISSTRNFIVSATAKIVTYETGAVSNQSGFGMMVRDDIYLDTNDSSLNTNYAAAGALGDGGGIFFGRENKLLQKKSKTLNYAVGTTYELSITKENQTIVVTIGDESYTWTDLDLVSIDGEYVYLCLFATRGIEIEFSNISYEETGESSEA